MRKVLIVRFSSIGDIVLTTPIIRCLKKQTQAEVHYLTKAFYKEILNSNPYIDKLIILNENFLQESIKEIKSQNYDLILDLQNGLRSFWIKLCVWGVKKRTVKKRNWEKILWLYLGVNLLKDHVVDRYFHPLKRLGVRNDNQGLDFFFPKMIEVPFNTSQKFITFSIGGSYEQKKLSVEQIINICNTILVDSKSSTHIVLLGGKEEITMGNDILQKVGNKNISNFCGKISLNQSAYLIQKSSLLLTNDTGLMHIGAALKKKIISFWGCTKPLLGFVPYKKNDESLEIIYNPDTRPCSKHGNFCRYTKMGCIKNLDIDVIKPTLLKKI